MIVALFGRKKEKVKTGGAIKPYEKVFKDGIQAMKGGDEDKAILSFRKLLRWVTEDVDKITKFSTDDRTRLSDILTKAGEAMIRLKEYDSAIKLLEKAKTINPNNFRAWMDIGRDLIQRNTQIPYALVCLREAAKLKPDNVEVHILLGDAYRTQGQDEKALKEYNEVLRIDPENEESLEKILKIQPDNVEILEKYVKVLEKKGKKDELVKAYNKIAAITGNREYLERGLKIDPENKELLMHKVRLLINDGNIEDARNILEKLLQSYPEDPDIEMLAEELKPEEREVAEVEVKPIEVEEVFGDMGFEELSLEEENPVESGEPEVTSLAETEPSTQVSETPEMAEVVEKESVEKPVEVEMKEMPVEKPEEIKVETVEAEKIPTEVEMKEIAIEKPEETKVEASVEVIPTPAPEEKVETPPQEVPVVAEEVEEKEKTIPPAEKFKREFESGNVENAKQMLGELKDDEILSFLTESENMLRFILEFLVEKNRYDLAIKFADKLAEINKSDENLLRKSRILIELGMVDDAENVLNELLKRNMKNGHALYEKARIMAIKGNEMGARNFLMIATRFTPEVKSKLMEDKYFASYRDKEWFRKLAL